MLDGSAIPFDDRAFEFGGRKSLQRNKKQMKIGKRRMESGEFVVFAKADFYSSARYKDEAIVG